MQKTYSSKELNEIIGYIDKSGSNNAKNQIITRCCNAGLKIKALDTPRGAPNQYIILEDNFHLPNEEWIKCYGDIDFEVSNLGRIRKITTKKLVGNKDINSGYIRVNTIDKATGKQIVKMVHRLVFFSFYPEMVQYEDSLQIDHINGKRDDNRLENLQALTHITNIQNRDSNQETIKTLTTELVIKYGYEAVQNKLNELLIFGL